MRPNVSLRIALFAAATLVGPSLLTAAPRIDHVGLECIEPGTFAVVLSGIAPDGEIQTAKVYFRSALYSDFYYVEMAREDDRFVGILPQPSKETPRVVYYVEAIDQAFESARSAEFDPPVEDPCDDRPGTAYLPGEPGITVGAVSAGASPLPPGFSAVGIVGTITALGVSSGVGGGIGAGTAVAVAAGAAAGVGGAVVVATELEETTSSTSTTSTAVAATTSVAPPSGPTTTVPPTTSVPGPTTSTSSTTTVPGSPSTTTTAPPTTSVPPTTTVAAPPLNPDCFQVDILGECRVRLDASCVNKPVDAYDWILDTEDEWKRVTRSGQVVAYEWGDDDCEDDEDITLQLTVRRGGMSASHEKKVRIPGDEDVQASRTASTTLDTELDLPGAEGRLLLNGATIRAVASERVRTNVAARRGTNVIEGVVVRASGEPGTWRFELPEARDRRVLEGAVLALDARSVVFRLSGAPGERVRFSFVVGP